MTASRPQMEPGWTVFFFIVFVCILAIAFWQVAKVPILEVLRWLRISEFWIVGLFTHSQDSCMQWLKSVKFGDRSPTRDIIVYTNECFGPGYLSLISAKDLPDYFMLSAPAIGAIEMKATYYYHYPLAAIYACLIYYILYISPRNQFKTRHTLESFIKLQAKMWPVISPIVNFNPIKSSARIPGTTIPDKLPLFAEALSPEEWISFHRIPVVNGIADREITRRAFISQLGPRWNGIEGQPPYLKALFAAFALKGAQKRTESDEFLGRISLCWSHKTGFAMAPELAAETRKILKDREIGGLALEIAAQHAYRTTALAGVLKWARTNGGVLAPAQFLWLRGVDRNLWYGLNNVGRRSYHSEGAGAMAHFMAEQNAKKALPIPRIDTAIVTLNQYLAGSGMPIPPRE